MKKISVVIPMYYEEQVANECYKRVKSVLENIENYEHEMIFINDGSKDKTLPILEEIASQDNTVKVISFSRNFGHQAAVTAGLKEVTGDAIVIIDADLQDPPELIPEMLEKVDDGSMGFTPAVQLSFLKKKEQKEMLDVMEFAQCTPSYQQTLSGWISPNCAKRVCWRKGY